MGLKKNRAIFQPASTTIGFFLVIGGIILIVVVVSTSLRAASGGSGDNATANSANENQNLTPQQVAEKWMTAYQSGDYSTDLALLHPDTKASFSGSADAFELQVKATAKDTGAILSWKVGELHDRGDEYGVALTVIREKCDQQCNYQTQHYIKLKRANNAWKVWQFQV